MTNSKIFKNIQTGETLDLTKTESLKKNALLKNKPHLWTIWDFEKNNELGLDIWKLGYGSHQRAYFICEKCGTVDYVVIRNRRQSNKCKRCCIKNNKALKLSEVDKKVFGEIHPDKNNIDVDNLGLNTKIKVWWLGKCGHEWEATIASRLRGSQCPYCTNKKILKGFNDIWTTNPNLASLLLNKEDGYNFVEMSNKKVDWKCPDCNTIIENMAISDIKTYGLSCSNCSDGISYPEKVMSNILTRLEIVFKNDTKFKWSNGKRYDFYIPHLNLIIETHGGQHKNGKFVTLGGNTIEEEMLNDKYKKEMALNNGIKEYIEIDCIESSIEYIKNSIMNSKLVKLINFDSIDWQQVDLLSTKSLVKQVCDFYNSKEELDIKEVSEKFKISNGTIFKYLNKGKKLGLTDYSKEESKFWKYYLKYKRNY